MPVYSKMGSSVATTPRSEVGSVSSVVRYQNVLYEIIREGDLLNGLKEANLIGESSQADMNPSEASGKENQAPGNKPKTQILLSVTAKELLECTHLLSCELCQKEIAIERDNYKKKKKRFIKMYEKLKSAYNIEIAKLQYDRKRWGQLEDLEMDLKKKKDDLLRWQARMDLDYKKRELDLEAGIRKRKDILSELARHTKEQHQQLALTMTNLLAESDKLKEKETTFSRRVKHAEQSLINKSETVHQQLTNIVTIMDENFEYLKKERVNLDAERMQFNQTKSSKTNCDDLNQHYAFIKCKLDTLKKQSVNLKHAKLRKISDKSSMTDNVKGMENILDQLYVAKAKRKDEFVKKSDHDQKKSDFNQKKSDHSQKKSDHNQKQSESGESADIRRSENDVFISSQNLDGRSLQDEQSSHLREIENKLELFKQDNEALRRVINQQQGLIKSLERQQVQMQAQVMSTHLQCAQERRVQSRSYKECSSIRSQRAELLQKVKIGESARSDIGERSYEARKLVTDAKKRLRKLEIEAEAVDKSYVHLMTKKDNVKGYTNSDGCLLGLDGVPANTPLYKKINQTASFSDENLTYGDGIALTTKHKSLKDFGNLLDKSLDELRRLYLTNESSFQSTKILINEHPSISPKSTQADSVVEKNIPKKVDEVTDLDKLSLLSGSNDDIKICEKYKNEIDEILSKCEKMTSRRKKSSKENVEIAERLINETDLTKKGSSSDVLVIDKASDKYDNAVPEEPNGDMTKQTKDEPVNALDVDYFDTFSDESLVYDSTSETASIFKKNSDSNESFWE